MKDQLEYLEKALVENDSLIENYHMIKLRIVEAARHRINGAILRSKTNLISNSFSDVTANSIEKHNAKVKTIKALRINGDIETNIEKLKAHKRDFYKTLYKKEYPQKSKIDFFFKICKS